MKTKPSKEKYVTDAAFKQESNFVHKEFDAIHKKFDEVHKDFDAVHKKIDTTTARLDQKINNVVYALGKNSDRLERVENTMATKSDINLILNRIDHLYKKEKRLSSLESAR